MSTGYSFLGRGYDTFAGKKKDEMLKFESKPGKGRKSFHMEVCETEEEIFKELEVKASLGVSYKGFDLDMKAAYASTLSKKKNTVTILVTAIRTRRGEIVGSSFKEKPSSVSELFRFGGDSYIREVEEGGMYVASYQFEATSEEQKKNISVEAKGKFKGQFSASANVDINEFSKSNKVQYVFDQQSFGGAEGFAEKPDKVYEFGLKFLETALTEPEILSFVTDSYYNVKGCPDGFEKVAEYTKAYTKVYFDGFKNSLAAIDRQADIARTKTRALKDLYQFYGIEGKLMGGMDGHLQKIDKLKGQIKAFRDSFNADAVPNPRQNKPDLDLSSLNVPNVTFEFVVGPWSGAEKGQKWKTWEGGEYWINSFVYPQRISANGTRVLQRVKVIYAKRVLNKDGSEGTPVEFAVADHGGWGDERLPDVDTVATLGPGEVVSVGAWWDTYPGVSECYVNKVAGIVLGRVRNGNKSFIRVISPGGAEGGGFKDFNKDYNTTFVGFDGYDDDVFYHSPTGGWHEVRTRYLTGLRAVFVKFDHGWQTLQMPDEY